MKHRNVACLVFGVLVACGPGVVVGRAQEASEPSWEEVEEEIRKEMEEEELEEREEKNLKKLQEELGRMDTVPKPGEEIVALRDASLMVETNRVGSVRKGEKLTVEQVQGNWLWVRSGQTRGWLDRRDVISEKLLDWYHRLPDGESVMQGETLRAKYKEILFETIGQGNTSSFIDSRVDMGGRVASHPVMIIGKNATFVLDREGPSWILAVTFTPVKQLFSMETPLIVNAAPRYGVVRPDDYVFIDAKSRLVLVNGEPRKSQ